MKKKLALILTALGCMFILASCAEDTPTPETKHVHTEVRLYAVDATCTDDGLTEGISCSECGEIIREQQIVPAKGHVEIIDFGKTATCSETGITEGKHCSICHLVTVKQESIPATAHTEVMDPGIDPTCTAEGKSEGKHCDTCGYTILMQEALPALGHTEIIDPAVSPTCTAYGKTEGKHCSVCNAVTLKQESIPATGHSGVTVAGTPATCTLNGKTDGSYCSVCKATLSAQRTISAIGHKWNEATCMAPETCANCNTTQGNTVAHKEDSSGNCVYCKKSMLIDMRTRVSAPLEESGKSFVFDASSYWEIRWYATNTSQKTIKYFRITVKYYNAVGDCIATHTSKRGVGPIAPGETFGISGYDWNFFTYDNRVIDVDSTIKVTISSITLEYTDGTTEKGTYNYSTSTEGKYGDFSNTSWF